jgi:hypothetical protein
MAAQVLATVLLFTVYTSAHLGGLAARQVAIFAIAIYGWWAWTGVATPTFLSHSGWPVCGNDRGRSPATAETHESHSGLASRATPRFRPDGLSA